MRLRFPTRFDNGDDNVKNSIVTFAADKLLCRSSQSNTELTPAESMACLAVRLGLDFHATSWIERAVERTQVERHMRICLAATDGFRTMVTISPSEPLLAEASWMVMRKWLGPKEAPKALLKHINDSYLNAGDRGEVVGALLVLLARDNAIRDRKPPQPKSSMGVSPADFKNDGITKGRIVTVPEFLDALVPLSSRPYVRGRMPICCSPGHSPATPLASAFAKAYIYSNHFIKVYDVKMVNREYLCPLFCRGAAVICANNQRGVDIVIPVLMGTIVHPEFITAIFIQVKNDPRFTNKISKSLFDMMNPIHLGLFSKDDEKALALPPVLRIVFALASERSGVVAPNPPVRRSSRRNSKNKIRFTAYDLWIAGVSGQSFGVIPDEQTRDQYTHLLHRMRNVFDGYGVVANNGGELDRNEQPRIEVRRMMHAAAASEDLHYQNYIENLATVPRTRIGYTVKNYFEECVCTRTRLRTRTKTTRTTRTQWR
jgi:hypothetical protein